MKHNRLVDTKMFHLSSSTVSIILIPLLERLSNVGIFTKLVVKWLKTWHVNLMNLVYGNQENPFDNIAQAKVFPSPT